MEKKLGLIGYGNMGSAIASSIVKAGALAPENILVYEVNPYAKRKAEAAGIRLVETLRALCAECDLMLLAVKPDKVSKVLRTAGSALEGKALMSIAAGVTSRKLKEFGGSYFLRVLRIMPNTPALVGAGCMVCCSDTDFTEEEKAEAKRIRQQEEKARAEEKAEKAERAKREVVPAMLKTFNLPFLLLGLLM